MRDLSNEGCIAGSIVPVLNGIRNARDRRRAPDRIVVSRASAELWTGALASRAQLHTKLPRLSFGAVSGTTPY